MTIADFGDSVLTLTFVDVLVVVAIAIIVVWISRNFR